MQIIINRIAVIAERRPTATKLKIATAVVISCINIAVFCIFIPSHMMPPVSQTFVSINRYWDRLSKVLIMLVEYVLCTGMTTMVAFADGFSVPSSISILFMSCERVSSSIMD
jgi:hypothetical protein